MSDTVMTAEETARLEELDKHLKDLVGDFHRDMNEIVKRFERRAELAFERWDRSARTMERVAAAVRGPHVQEDLDLLTHAEAAQLLKVSPNTLDRWHKEGLVDGLVRVGSLRQGEKRWRRQTMLRWMQRMEEKARG